MRVTANFIELHNISKNFKNHTGPLFENFSLTIRQGEFVALLGPSGCGKSTLLKIIAQLERLDTGEIKTSFNQNEVGFVFQEAHLLPWRNVFENVMLPLEFEQNRKESTALEALTKLDIQDAKLKYPHQLSGGMKMRASIARALVKKPKLLLLDEPFAALDEIIRLKLCEELRAFWEKEKITVVFVTHSITEASFLANRILVLSKKPAKTIYDQEVNLPLKRDQSLRSTIEFANQTKNIFQVMSQNEK